MDGDAMKNGHVPAPVNPAWMSEPVRIKRVGTGFMANGRAVELGEVVTIDKFMGIGLCIQGKAIMIEGD